MEWLVKTLSLIPKELWTPIGTLGAGIFTAIVAFTAVMLQNRSAERRHQREIANDAKQRMLEREAELRKLVYIDAVEQLSALLVRLTILAKMDITDDDMDSLSRGLASINRLYAIAEIDTVRAVQKASSA